MNRVLPLVRMVSLGLLALALVVIGIEQFRGAIGSAVRKARLSAAQDAARVNPLAVAALDTEVKHQAAASLARDQHQQGAAVLAVAAAATLVALLQTRGRPQLAPTTITLPLAERHRAAATDDPVATTAGSQHEIPPVDLAPLEAIVTRVGRGSEDLIPLLHAISAQYHYLPPAVLAELPRLAEVSADQVNGVASFYQSFRTTPRGEKLVRVCNGTACHVAGADRITSELRRSLGIPAGHDTDANGKYTVDAVGCLGCCTRAPVVAVDQHVAGPVAIEALEGLLTETATVPQRDGVAPSIDRAAPAAVIEVRIGMGSCCVAGGSNQVRQALVREIHRRKLPVTVKQVGCVGMCHMTPMVELVVPGRDAVLATRVNAAEVPRLVDLIRRRRFSLTSLQLPAADLEPSPCTLCRSDHQFRRYSDPQVRIVTEHCGELDPERLDEYLAHDGLAALRAVLTSQTPERVIDTVEASGLRGRGGGGFPTARKWRLVAAGSGEKYLVCNGDEGDPGAFMDRMVMESYPHRVLEGMAIAAFAVGAQRGIVYVRHEYPLAVERMRHAIEQLRVAGWLGEHIAGTEFSFDIRVVEGAGAFVCGEETALIESLMGRRGTPQQRPPYPAQRGLWGRPTLVNNVETLANLPWIFRHGADRFAALGTSTSKGAKVFALAGKTQRGGLIEVPMGTTIRDVVQSIGGGVAPGRTFKAVQIGGPSGGCIPAELADTAIDYESLTRIGAIMGSGGLVVLDDTDCMVDMARYFLKFTQGESCGHCTFCRVGTRRLSELLERICAGQGQLRDLVEIESLSASVIAGSQCGLGRTAPNPVLTTLRYFRHEYEAHLAGRCPAGRCKSLIRYQVTRDCSGCTLCAQKCPVGAIPLTPYVQHTIDSAICTRCDVCRVACPEHAIEVV
jgi:NADH-quinone oxidoreductase subunit F